MGYTKVVQAGNFIEVFNYQKNYVHKDRSGYKKQKRKKTADYRGNSKISFRSKASIQRARRAFFRIVASNLDGADAVSFVTLTLNKEYPIEVCYIFLCQFFKRLRKIYGEKIRYIGVPEWQKNGRVHYHILVWGLQKPESERYNRNIQRQWGRGFVDVRIARDASIRIAGYMAKYMAKASSDERLRNIRAYTCSRNIKRPFEAGSNSLSDYLAELIPVDNSIVKVAEYDTMYMGRCYYQQFKKPETCLNLQREDESSSTIQTPLREIPTQM